ncbi:MAG: ISAs1 family transposase [Pirellulales bacterium]|nr:ISAs1 family transposase [Pirellulales bacterium]
MSQSFGEDVGSILECFEDLDDPRSAVNRKHLLGDLIVIAICAVIAGADGPQAIGVWAASNQDWLKQHLELPHGIPSHDTIGRLLALLKPAAFQTCFQNWIRALRTDDEPTAGETARGQQKVIAIDGKALRRSHDRKRNLGALFLVSAWSVQHGVSLGQLATEEKSNEITAIPELIDHLDVGGATVTIDAAGCQKTIAAKIVDGGGDYVLALKGNQGNLHKSVEDWITEQIGNGFVNVTVRKYEQTVKGHGRVDHLTYYQFNAPKTLSGFSNWKKFRTIGIAIRVSEKGDQVSREVRYFISSLRLGVKRFAAAVRGHWAIENTLHWCLDVTFREDESRLRDRHAADNVAWLKRFALSLLKQRTDKESIAMRRRMAGWNTDYLSQVLGIQKT